MAFAITNARTGTVGNLKMYAGDWSGTQGDANGTVTLSGGRCYSAEFSNFDASSQEDRPTPTSISESGGTITVTVANLNTVTSGRFIIIYS